MSSKSNKSTKRDKPKHSATSLNNKNHGQPSKHGGGGKFTWGQPGDEAQPVDVDPRDPNYEAPSELEYVEVASPEGLEAQLSKYAKDESVKLFVQVVASDDPATGESWCGDCRRAKQPMHEALSQVAGHVVVLNCPVTRAEYKGNAEHPYRTDERLQLTAVPTLYRWTADGPTDVLVEGDCSDEHKLGQFIAAA